MIKIYSHNYGASSKELAKALGAKILKKIGSIWRPRIQDHVINWGSTKMPDRLFDAHVYNHPSIIGFVVNKGRFFRSLREKAPDTFNYPLSWSNREQANEWLRNNPGHFLVCRAILRGSKGAGITIVDNPDLTPIVPLYTQYIKKKREFRVHVVNNKVIDAVQKKQKREFKGIRDTKIRNTHNGYVFARTDVVIPQAVFDGAIEAMKFFGIDFGAVDIVYNDHYEKAYVLEINTAPGIEGTTVQRYKEAFEEWLT